MSEEVFFKTVTVDGAIFVFAVNKENTLIGIAEASRLFFDDSFPNIYFFNRLYIQENYRGNGYSKELLQRFCKEADNKKVDIELTINPYGAVTYDRLKELYDSYGFKQVGQNHFLRKNNRSFITV